MDLYVTDTNLSIEWQVRKKSEELIDLLVLQRKKKKMTQQDIADKSGMKRENISRIENKKNIPTLDVLIKYANCLDMELKIALVEKK